MKILSLFDGISCARVAIERAGIKIEKYYASEIDKYAIQIAQKNYPDTIQVGSITELKGEDFKDIDLIIGGSPCQDLSIAGKRKGLCGERSGLFYEYVRILNEVKPKYFVLENVNSMPKEAKQMITEELGVESIMINAALVSAQNRKRLFWVGKLVGDKYEQVKMELPEDEGILLKDILEEEVDEKYYVSEKHTQAMINSRKSKKLNIPKLDGKCGTIIASYYKIPNDGNYIEVNKSIRIGHLNKGGQGDRIYSEEGKSVSLKALGGGGGAKTGLYAVSQRGRNIVDGKRKDIKGSKTEQRIEIGGKDKAHTITSVQKDSMVMKNERIRKLTPIECERLQGLPDNYTEGVSNTQRYKALGNGFNVEVIKHIIQNL